jgi:RNA polymerase sigma-70 factor (ECF subfamily)
MIRINHSDETLLHLLKNDDELAFQALYERYWLAMYQTTLRKLHRKDIAEELAQDLFLMLWRRRKDLNDFNLKAFLSISLKHLIIDYVRKNIHEAKYLEHLKEFFPPSHFATSEAVYFNDLNEAVQKSLTQLPAKTREVFVLNRFENLTIREIAQRLNLSEKTIEYHLSRSTHFLKLNLQEFCPLWLVAFLFF